MHVLCSGLSPPEAEEQYLNSAKQLAFYGVDLHYANVCIHCHFAHCTLRRMCLALETDAEKPSTAVVDLVQRHHHSNQHHKFLIFVYFSSCILHFRFW